MPDLRHLVTTAAVAVLAIAAYQAVHGTSQAPAAASSHPGGVLQPFMRFSGTGSVSVKPDQGTISFSTQATGSTLAAAQEGASRAMSSLIHRMRADGVARSDLRTENVSGYARPQQGDYIAQQSLSVTVRDLSHTGRLLADGAAAGAHETYGVSFSDTHRRQSYDRALQAAVADARAKAEAAAQAAGLHLGSVVSVNETHASSPVYGTEFQAVAGPVRSAAVPVKRGTQKVSADVTVVFSYSG